jgi:hypothetical protein
MPVGARLDVVRHLGHKVPKLSLSVRLSEPDPRGFGRLKRLRDWLNAPGLSFKGPTPDFSDI